MKILYLINATPYGSNHNFELIDSAMVSAIFDFEVSILFRKKGVLSLLQRQNGDIIEGKTFSKVLAALPTYNIRNLYCCEESMRDQRIKSSDLIEKVGSCSIEEQRLLISSQDTVISGSR